MTSGSQLRRIVLCLACMLSLVMGEFVVISIAHRSQFAGAFEIARAFRLLLPTSAMVVPWLACFTGLLVDGLLRSQSRIYRWGLSVLFACIAGIFAWSMTYGRLFSTGLRRPFAVTFLTVTVFVISWSLIPRVGRILQGRSLRSFVSVLGGVLFFIVCEVSNVTILPRLYEPFHWVLTTVSLVFSSVFMLPWIEERQGHRLTPKMSGMILLTVPLTGVTTTLLQRTTWQYADNIKFLFTEHAPILKHVMDVTTPLFESRIERSATIVTVRSKEQSMSIKGRDVLLITIDALRADHVGIYGYNRNTTPHLDAFAKEAIVFDAAYTQTPHTSYAISSLMTGKYMRPLLLQELGSDSETWADQLRRYGYKTAAFYPPAVFFIDQEKFQTFQNNRLGFEYAKVQFSSAEERVNEVQHYVSAAQSAKPRFLWVHFFEPHEPYVKHEPSFGDRDIDRYDDEIAEVDRAIDRIVKNIRLHQPEAIVIVTADHGEEFGDHGGRYHGTTVYEEQVRVPLIVSIPGITQHRRVTDPVQLIDLLPTILRGLEIPIPARVRGNDLGPLLTGQAHEDFFAYSETDRYAMLAKDAFRLICERRISACTLYNIQDDAAQSKDIQSLHLEQVRKLREELIAIDVSHGNFEHSQKRGEQGQLPVALRRGLAGDVDAATDVATFLDDADPLLRRKAAELLFRLRSPKTASSLRLALTRDEDETVRNWAALTLSRLGEGAARTNELLMHSSLEWRRKAALVLAETGDHQGEDILVQWWKQVSSSEQIEAQDARDLLHAFVKIRSSKGARILESSLDGNVRFRADIAKAIGEIGDETVMVTLAKRLPQERYQDARIAMVDALVKLKAGTLLREPLVVLLGRPDPPPNGLDAALRADILASIGGPAHDDFAKLMRYSNSGVSMMLTVPKLGDTDATRVVCLAKSTEGVGEIHIAKERAVHEFKKQSSEHHDVSSVPDYVPELDEKRSLVLQVSPSSDFYQVFAPTPASFGAKRGKSVRLAFYTTHGVVLRACALIALSHELPPPPPKPWVQEAQKTGDSH